MGPLTVASSSGGRQDGGRRLLIATTNVGKQRDPRRDERRLPTATTNAGEQRDPRRDDRRLLIATSNAGKQREYRRLLAPLAIALATPGDLGLALEVVEDGDSFAANAALKARAFAVASGLPALADDSGLEVDALGGFPGIRSSRWAPGGDAGRVAALLARMQHVPDDARTARFRAAAALAWPDGRIETGEGVLAGRIARAPRGESGFGYDPVFLVETAGLRPAEAYGVCEHAEVTGAEVTVAELTDAEKDAVSHRARAVRALWPALLALSESG